VTFELVAAPYTECRGFYIQDDFKISKDVQFNFGTALGLTNRPTAPAV
jgi:hypothetical protein